MHEITAFQKTQKSQMSHSSKTIRTTNNELSQPSNHRKTMKANISVLLIAACVSLATLFSGTKPSYSCSFGDSFEKHRISYVDPDLLSDSIYQSFYKTVLREHQAADSYWEIPHKEFKGEEWPTIKEQENLEDWKRYFDGKISDRSLHDFIYKSEKDKINSLLLTLEQENLPTAEDVIVPARSEWGSPDTLYYAEAIRLISKHRDIPFLQYFSYALECSQHAAASDPWKSKTVPSDTEPRKQELIDKGLELHSTTTSDFLKLRYGYQVVRLARYAGQYEKAIELYNKLVEPNPVRGPIRYWALGHKAGAARLAGKPVLANYWFAQVFDSCEGEREIAVRDIKLRNEEDWNAVYKLAANDHERTTLWMLKGFKTEGLTFDYLHRMYELEPHSPQLALATLRELHRIESFLYSNLEVRDWETKQRGGFIDLDYEYDDEGEETIVESRTNHDEYHSNSPWQDQEIGYERYLAPGRMWDTLTMVQAHKNEEKDSTEIKVITVLSGRDYVLSFRNTMLKLAREGKTTEPALWYMIAGYIDLMDNDFQVANECLSEAEQAATGTGNHELQQQIFLLDLMRRVKSKGIIDREIENQIYQTLEWFQKKQEKNRHSKFDRVMAAMGQQYLVQNDLPRALMAFASADDYSTIRLLLDVYSNDDDLKALQEMLQNGPETDYEKMLFASIKIPINGVLDLRATKMLRQGKFREAVDLFNHIPPFYWNEDREHEYGEWDPNPIVLYANTEWFYSSTDTTLLSYHNLISGFYTRTKSDQDEASLHATKFNKKTFALKALSLVEEANRLPERADSAYFKLGNLLFNNWRWSQGDIIGSWDGSLSEYSTSIADYPFNIEGIAQRIDRKDKEFRSEFGTRDLARTFYQKAMAATENRELAAHCAYMLDICLKRPLTNIVHHPTAKEQDRTGYQLLITKYRDTKFSKWVLSQCSVYKYFGRAQSREE